MQYYVRSRGQDDISGPFTVAELESRLQNGSLSSTQMAAEDPGMTVEQLKMDSNCRWMPLTSVPGLKQQTPAVPREPINSLRNPPSRGRGNPLRAHAVRNMVMGGLWCVGGTIVTVLSYASASNQSGGGSYVVAWGAILFGAIQFFRGLAGVL